MKKIWALIAALTLLSLVLLPVSQGATQGPEEKKEEPGIINQPTLKLTYSDKRFIVTNEGDETAENLRFSIDLKAKLFFFNSHLETEKVSDDGELAPGDSWVISISGLFFGIGPATLEAQAFADNDISSNTIEKQVFLLGFFILGL